MIIYSKIKAKTKKKKKKRGRTEIVTHKKLSVKKKLRKEDERKKKNQKRYEYKCLELNPNDTPEDDTEEILGLKGHSIPHKGKFCHTGVPQIPLQFRV